LAPQLLDRWPFTQKTSVPRVSPNPQRLFTKPRFCNLRWGLDSDSHRTALRLHNGDNDFVANRKRFAFLACNYQHPCLPLRPRVTQGTTWINPQRSHRWRKNSVSQLTWVTFGSRGTPTPQWLCIAGHDVCSGTLSGNPMLSPTRLDDVHILHFEPATLGGQRSVSSFGVRYRAIIWQHPCSFVWPLTSDKFRRNTQPGSPCPSHRDNRQVHPTLPGSLAQGG